MRNSGLYFIMPFALASIVYGDETGFNLHIRRKFGRAPRGGVKVRSYASTSWGRNISVIAAMTRSELLHFRTFIETYNAEKIKISIREVINRCGKCRKYFIMDNFRFDHCQIICNEIETGGHSLLFIPAYSPQLNPLELMFSKLKKIVKTGTPSTNTNELFSKIRDSDNHIFETDCHSWTR